MNTRAQPYHHGNLRPVLVDTAVELARTTGPDGVVLREVARRAGVSHNAAYRHFDDRAALLAEVSDRAMSDLEQAMVTRDRFGLAHGSDGPRDGAAARDRPRVRRLRAAPSRSLRRGVHRARGARPSMPTSRP